MSYFAEDLANDLLADECCAIRGTEVDVETGEGVLIERRSLLWLSAGAVGALLAGSSSLRGQDPQPRTPSEGDNGLTYAQFLEQVLPLARRVVAAEGRDEEAYLMTVAAAMSRLRQPAAPLREAMQAFRREHGQDGERFPLAAVQMQLEPGGGFAHHDHLNYDGVIMGIEGEVRIRNFDVVGAAPDVDSRETFRIRQTRDDLVLPGRFSTLGRDRDNIHELVAGKQGARVLDVFTFFEKEAGSRYLDVETEPRDAEQRVYDAAWRPRRRRRRRR